MPNEDFQHLLEEAATESLKNVIVPLIKSKLPSEKADRLKVNIGMQSVARYTSFAATQMHDRGLALMAVKMITGDDREAAKELILKHIDSKWQIPEKKKK